MTNSQADKPSVEGLPIRLRQIAAWFRSKDWPMQDVIPVLNEAAEHFERLASQSAAAAPIAPVAPEGHEWREDVKAFVRHNANGTDSVYNPLPDIARELNVMLGSAIQHGDGEWITGYTIKTGALHRILGFMQAAGHSVVIPNGLAKEPAAAPPSPVLLEVPTYYVVMYGGEPASMPHLREEAALADLDKRNKAYPGDQEQRRIAKLRELMGEKG